MDERFGQAYQVLFDNFQIASEIPFDRGGKGLPLMPAFLRAMINQVDSEFEQGRRHLRADGKYLLLTSFYSMVYMPLMLVGNIPFAELIEAINSDMKDIVSYGGKEQPEGDISGHTLLSAVAVSWPRLRTTKFRLWGDE